MIIKNQRFEEENKKVNQSKAKLIWTPGVEKKDEYCLFRKTIMCDKLPKSAILDIFVQSEFRLYVNGEALLRGNAGISEKGEYSETDIIPFLKQGKNVIAIFACYHAYPLSKIALRQKGVIFNLRLDYTGARQEEFVSDSSVKCMICDAYSEDAPRMCSEKATVEVMDNSMYPADWTEVDFDDLYWEDSTEISLCDTNYFDMPISEYKPMREHMYSAKAIIAAGTGDDLKGISLKDTFYHETVKCELNKLYVVGVECEIQPIDKGQHSYILVDFDKVCTGYLKLDIDGYGDDIIDVIFAKKLVDGVPEISGVARFILKAENNVLETNFDKNEFQYVLLVFRNPVRTSVVKGIWAIESEYPFENSSEFLCDDDKINAAFETAKARIKSKFSNQILCGESIGERNTIFSQRTFAAANSYLTGDTLHFKKMLSDFASMESEGAVISKRSLVKSFDFYDIFAFALALRDYCGLSGDENVEEIFERAVSMFKWVSRFEQDGVLSPVLVRKELNSEALLNLSYIYSLFALSDVAGVCSDRQAARFYESKAAKLKKNFRQKYMQDVDTLLQENISVIYDICSLMVLALDDSSAAEKVIGAEFEKKADIFMPVEFARAMKKSGKLKASYDALTSGALGYEAVPVIAFENISGVDFMGKKNIKSVADVENFSDISTKIFTPKGVVDVYVKDKVTEKNTLSVNINQTDGEF